MMDNERKTIKQHPATEETATEETATKETATKETATERDCNKSTARREHHPSVNINKSQLEDERDLQPMNRNDNEESRNEPPPFIEQHGNELKNHKYNNKEDENYTNIIINYKTQMNLVCDNMLCRMCKSKMTSDCFSRSSYGVATTISICCTNCLHRSYLGTNRNIPERLEIMKKDNKCSNVIISPKRNSTYTLNMQLVLFLQCFGIRGTAARQFVSGLGLSSGSWTFGNYTALEEEIALHQIKLGEEIIAKNVQKELDASPVGIDGRKNAGASMDTGCVQRGTGKTYNSDSGISVMFGHITNLVIAFFYMLRVCIKCIAAVSHGMPFCSMNYEGSLKGMEAHGGFENVMNIFNKRSPWQSG